MILAKEFVQEIIGISCYTFHGPLEKNMYPAVIEW